MEHISNEPMEKWETQIIENFGYNAEEKKLEI